MKKFLLALLFINVMTHATPVDNLNVYGGLNLNGEISENSYGRTDKEDVKDPVFFIGAEAHKQVYKFAKGNVELGFGAKYDSLLTVNSSNGDLKLASFIPVYGSLKSSIKISPDISVYLQGVVGYPIPLEGATIKNLHSSLNLMGGSAKLIGNLYSRIALGIEKGNLQTGLGYNIIKSSLFIEDPSKPTETVDFSYSTIALTVGYKFDTKNFKK